MKGICRLTKKETELRNSHIYPKFVIEWMKATGSKYQRGYKTPNKREQDGYKKYLLSEEAEQLFSKREKWFAENIFRKYLDNPQIQMIYTEKLFYFAISMLWRILVLELELPKTKKFPFYETLKNAEKEWREFLLNGTFPLNFPNAHLILTDNVKDHTLPSGSLDYFMTRMLDGTTVFSKDYKNCSIYVKFSRFIFWSFLSGGDEKNMENTKINAFGGIIGIPQRPESIQFMTFIPNRVKMIDEMEYASEQQQQKIIKEIKQNKEHYENSELLESLEFDCKMKAKNKNNSW